MPGEGEPVELRVAVGGLTEAEARAEVEVAETGTLLDGTLNAVPMSTVIEEPAAAHWLS